MVAGLVTYYRVTYEPAGFWPRRCVMHSIHRERHGRSEWLHGIEAATARPLYLCELDVTEIVAVVV